MVVYKIRINSPKDIVYVPMQTGAKILRAHEQDGALCLWFYCDPNAEVIHRGIRIAGTGHPIEFSGDSNPVFIGTVLMQSGLVWHLFDLGEFPF